MAAVGAVCALAAVASVVPVVEHIVAAALVALGLGWLAVAVVRRERRIRARIADPRTRPKPVAGGRVPALRAGSGVDAPVSPALTDHTPTPTGGA